jgi:hypothetical protein
VTGRGVSEMGFSLFIYVPSRLARARCSAKGSLDIKALVDTNADQWVNQIGIEPLHFHKYFIRTSLYLVFSNKLGALPTSLNSAMTSWVTFLLLVEGLLIEDKGKRTSLGQIDRKKSFRYGPVLS